MPWRDKESLLGEGVRPFCEKDEKRNLSWLGLTMELTEMVIDNARHGAAVPHNFVGFAACSLHHNGTTKMSTSLAPECNEVKE